MSMNKVALLGRMTADPELRHTSNEVPVCTFRLAVDRDFRNSDGSRDTDFLPIVCWRGTAEYASRNLTKGRMVAVLGSVQVREFTDKNGDRKVITEVMASNIYPCDKKETERKDPFYPIDDRDEGDIPF